MAAFCPTDAPVRRAEPGFPAVGEVRRGWASISAAQRIRRERDGGLPGVGLALTDTGLLRQKRAFLFGYRPIRKARLSFLGGRQRPSPLLVRMCNNSFDIVSANMVSTG